MHREVAVPQLNSVSVCFLSCPHVGAAGSCCCARPCPWPPGRSVPEAGRDREEHRTWLKVKLECVVASLSFNVRSRPLAAALSALKTKHNLILWGWKLMFLECKGQNKHLLVREFTTKQGNWEDHRKWDFPGNIWGVCVYDSTWAARILSDLTTSQLG